MPWVSLNGLWGFLGRLLVYELTVQLVGAFAQLVGVFFYGIIALTGFRVAWDGEVPLEGGKLIGGLTCGVFGIVLALAALADLFGRLFTGS